MPLEPLSDSTHSTLAPKQDLPSEKKNDARFSNRYIITAVVIAVIGVGGVTVGSLGIFAIAPLPFEASVALLGSGFIILTIDGAAFIYKRVQPGASARVGPLIQDNSPRRLNVEEARFLWPVDKGGSIVLDFKGCTWGSVKETLMKEAREMGMDPNKIQISISTAHSQLIEADDAKSAEDVLGHYSHAAAFSIFERETKAREKTDGV